MLTSDVVKSSPNVLPKSDENDADLHAFVHDAKLFVLSYVGMMAEFPLQIYCSALVFAPSRSLVRQQFVHEVPTWIGETPQGRENWSAKRMTIETGLQNVPVEEFSNGRWRIDLGDVYTTGKPGWNDVSEIAFLPNGQTLAAYSRSGVGIWDSITGAPGKASRWTAPFREGDWIILRAGVILLFHTSLMPTFHIFQYPLFVSRTVNYIRLAWSIAAVLAWWVHQSLLALMRGY